MQRLDEILKMIRPSSEEWKEKAWKRLRSQIRPRGSLGRLEEMAARLAAMRESLDVPLRKKVIFTMAGDHGVAEEGVSAYPQEVTAQMVFSFVQGWASINVLADHAGIDVRVVDMGIASDLPEDWNVIRRKVRKGTANFTKGPAMTREEAEQGLVAGAELVLDAVQKEGYQLIGTGDMGIANTTPSTAILAVFGGYDVEGITGRGTGIDDEGMQRKIAVIKRGIEVNRPDPSDPVDVLAKVGGCEIAGLAGAVLGAAAARVPIVCDGFIATAGALVAVHLVPAAKDYLFISHRSQEKGHALMADLIGLKPVLDLDMRLGEGTGSALAMPIVEASARVLMDIKTFEEAGVTDTGH
ncbi:MAG: nicotinate-nucleotide--dimethylbenzimidazole phosphoribosyltransferase [Deltaproteobacteria bacterium]|nr:nicotinate-nucleotide--dimethylbenzimidazole phosphoribosyltransferase [Deltaproteobacteria bacterium]MBW2068257.1 nicotinate-nucleotide--dimethylbenzimidazole phosphoribosyltransferase [Deltaproteobacteria bacterium]